RNANNQENKSRNIINQGVCPMCGGKLVLRRGKFGAFYGCSNYPECKFTLNS
ncbi:MAG: topoisomerase DNA-binding C4 zinc finger domain-containing protein, partial [Clostridia bacterium]|nr:topoisomerase DNA-binding C4 zinc finger domain-containing protein [Clostridia bacterium]